MGKRILFYVLRKFVIFTITLLIGLLVGFSACLIIGGQALTIGFSSLVIVALFWVVLISILSMLSDLLFMKLRKWRKFRLWLHLGVIVVPLFCLVYFYFLGGGIFFELPVYRTIGNVTLLSSILFSICYWGIDELSRIFLSRKRALLTSEPIEKI